MRRLARLFTHRRVLRCRQHFRVRFPEIRVALSVAKEFGDGLPQTAARLLAAVANDEGDNLTSLTTQGDPNPTLPGLLQHK